MREVTFVAQMKEELDDIGLVVDGDGFYYFVNPVQFIGQDLDKPFEISGWYLRMSESMFDKFTHIKNARALVDNG